MQANAAAAANAAMMAEMVLKYPEPFPLHPQVQYEMALQYLLKAHQLATQVPFQFGYIDKPSEGSLFMIFVLPQQRVFPNDGIRYQEQETRYNIPAGANRELEVSETKFGFIPEVDNVAFRVRRRFRLSKGGSPQLMIVHYSTGQSAPILPALRHQPVRGYPLRPINEPAMFVLGDKTGQRVPVSQRPGIPSAGAVPGMAAMGGGMQHQAAMLAQQNREMEQLERRQARERAVGMASQGQHHAMEDDSGDELDHISNRSLALARYKRNHDYMNEVFMHAAFGDKSVKEPEDPFASFKEDDMKEKIANIEKDMQGMAEKAAARRAEAAAQRGQIGSDESAAIDVAMDGLQAEPVHV